jgi:hypothetical protein
MKSIHFLITLIVIIIMITFVVHTDSQLTTKSKVDLIYHNITITTHDDSSMASNTLSMANKEKEEEEENERKLKK